MRRSFGSMAIPGCLVLVAACTSRPEGTCEKDSHCSGARVCFEGKCISMKQLAELTERREADARPKVCEDGDGDGVRAGDGCPKGELLDCNDADANMAPGRNEICDGVDNDCDGLVNEGHKGCVQTLFGGATWGNQEKHRLSRPASVVYDPAGFVIVSDSHHLWRVALEGRVELLAGSELSNFADGNGDQARFSYPLGIERAPDGSVYVADCKNNCIRKVSSGGDVSTVAGFCSNLTKHAGKFADGSTSTARFYCPADVARTADGSLVVVDRANARIRRIGTDGTVTTLAGVGPVEVKEGEGQDGFNDGPADEARFNDPQSVLVDPEGIIYVAESFNCRIRRIDPAENESGERGEVGTLAGESDTLLGVGGFADGRGKGVKFSYPHGMAWDGKGNMLLADTGNSVIRMVTPEGKVRTLYGKPGESKYVDGPIPQARFMTPMDLAPGPDGSLFVVDAGADRIRWIVP